MSCVTFQKAAKLAWAIKTLPLVYNTLLKVQRSFVVKALSITAQHERIHFNLRLAFLQVKILICWLESFILYSYFVRLVFALLILENPQGRRCQISKICFQYEPWWRLENKKMIQVIFTHEKKITSWEIINSLYNIYNNAIQQSQLFIRNWSDWMSP